MSTHYQGTTAEVRALDAFIKLLRAAASVARHTRTVFEAAGLTESQFGVLEALFHLGPLTPGDLGRKILKSPGNLTLVLDNLVRQGLIVRQPSADRRCRPVALTPRGHALVARLLPRHVQVVTAAFRGLTAAEQTRLAALCRKLGLSLDPYPPSPERKSVASRPRPPHGSDPGRVRQARSPRPSPHAPAAIPRGGHPVHPRRTP
ncbi:MAG: Transcriptional regulator, MarR family [Candidatus Ozemobacter sibiricus]|uniref:Transcriptional regulator, MarR family n=1 Tax=Candidatus Ozemobacter sibiricus TaxID=2268124 RepID=A0A367ZIJ3_9BACT|nr:MAG: Transcriptional regulator, MarR family [Candidatus Ozemobacter sibiricus]